MCHLQTIPYIREGFARPIVHHAWLLRGDRPIHSAQCDQQATTTTIITIIQIDRYADIDHAHIVTDHHGRQWSLWSEFTVHSVQFNVGSAGIEHVDGLESTARGAQIITATVASSSPTITTEAQ